MISKKFPSRKCVFTYFFFDIVIDVFGFVCWARSRGESYMTFDQRSYTSIVGLQYTAIHCNTLQCTAIHWDTLQHTATHCNTLQHTATHCNAINEINEFDDNTTKSDDNTIFLVGTVALYRVWGRHRVHRAFVYSDWFVCYVCSLESDDNTKLQSRNDTRNEIYIYVRAVCYTCNTWECVRTCACVCARVCVCVRERE